jgi:hypothetical protein
MQVAAAASPRNVERCPSAHLTEHDRGREDLNFVALTDNTGARRTTMHTPRVDDCLLAFVREHRAPLDASAASLSSALTDYPALL